MTQPVDVAYVDIVVRDKSLAKARKDIKAAIDDIDKDLNGLGDNIDSHLGDVFDNIDNHFKETAKVADRAFDSIADEAEKSLARIDRGVPDTLNRLQRGFRGVRASVGDALSDLGERLEDGFRRLGRGIGSVLGPLGQLAGVLGSFAASSPLLVLILALAPAIIALAAALANLVGLVGLLPAGLGVLLSVIIPTVIAFQNFGEAVSALASGDIEKIDEALKKLSPSARQVAREVAAATPVLQAFQRALQEAFFSQVRGSFTQLLSILPRIQGTLAGVTGSMGRLVASLAQFLATPRQVEVFNALFRTTAGIIDRLSPVFLRLLDAIGSVVIESLPFVERFAAAFGRALDAFSAFIGRSIETGAFDKFIEDAFTTVKELLDLLKAVGGLIGTIFAGTEQSGHDLIVTLTDITNQLNAFLKSAEGQRALEDLSFLVKAFGAILGGTIVTLEFLSFALHNSLDLFEFLGRSIFAFVGFVGDLIGAIPGKLAQLGAFLATLPDLIGGFFRAAFDRALFTVGAGIGLILFAIQVLPTKIAEFLATLPDRIAVIIGQVTAVILTGLQGAIDGGRNIVVSGFNAVVDFISSVPDRIAGLIPVFGQAGKNLIQSFMNGFRSVGGFIGDVAGDIVGAVKGFLNKAIDRINSGIATIDAVLPGELGRIPRLAAGAIVQHQPGGILANVGEGSEDEVVAPLSKLMGMISGAVASGGGVVFGPGAINVNFAGVVPTESEARATGQAVGDGIVAALTRRNIRTQLRTA